jgi:hypothetical protein
MKIKSNFNFSIFRLIIVLILFIPIIYSEYENHKSQILYGAMVYVPIYFICLGLFVPIIIFDILLFWKKRNLKNLTPTFIGLLLILISISIYNYHNYKIYQKSIFKATSNIVNLNDNDDIKYIIDFKENHNYLVKEIIHQGLLTNYYYGKFSKKDSVYIFNNSINENKISNRFIIRTKINKNKKEKFLIQLNQKNIEIFNKFQFKITTK